MPCIYRHHIIVTVILFITFLILLSSSCFFGFPTCSRFDRYVQWANLCTTVCAILFIRIHLDPQDPAFLTLITQVTSNWLIRNSRRLRKQRQQGWQQRNQPQRGRVQQPLWRVPQLLNRFLSSFQCNHLVFRCDSFSGTHPCAYNSKIALFVSPSGTILPSLTFKCAHQTLTHLTCLLVSPG